MSFHTRRELGLSSNNEGFPGSRGFQALILFQKRLKGGFKRKVIEMFGKVRTGENEENYCLI